MEEIDIGNKHCIHFRIRFNDNQVCCVSCNAGDAIDDLYSKIYQVSNRKIELLALVGSYPQLKIPPSSLKVKQAGLTNNSVLVALSEIKSTTTLTQGHGSFTPIREINDPLAWQQLLKDTNKDYLIMCLFYTSKVNCVALVDQYESLSRDSNYNSRVLFYKINADKNPSCVYTDGSMTLPKFAFYRNQQVIDVHIGNNFEQLKSSLRWNAFHLPLSTNQMVVSEKYDRSLWTYKNIDDYYDPR
ncbi:uncharacterized protein TRIADDRAFT_54529 [Trichoplax adhaerens]|uniref:Uncharacterized protein n=1 Tax=Trichoplax adhaerens TaxID=10228 RepID=B3RSA6_TRIAD|nr:predicted protein [Trichoplax adhaerens]EDV26483.1 predicted protein [Trichoplax adhaerens]|eukprot:XP_002110479.1 predicted protein [Trichoplax adhaerens]